MAFPATGTHSREDDGPAGTADPVPPADAQQQQQQQQQQQLPIQLKQGIHNDQRKDTEEIIDTEQHSSRPAPLQSLDDSPPRQQQQPHDQHRKESEQSPQLQQPVLPIYPLLGPSGLSQLQSPIQEFHMQQALLERQRQMRLALAEKQQQALKVRRQARKLSGRSPQPQRPVQHKFGPCVPPPVQDPALEQVLHEELRLVMLARQAEHLQQNQPQQPQQPQSQWQPKQGPPRPRSLEELQAFQTQLLALEPDERRRAIERRMIERKAQRQEQQQAEQEKQQAEQQQQQQQPQPQPQSQGPPQPQSSEELRAFQTQLMALEAENRRRLTERRLAERQAQQQQDQHQEESEQSPQPQQPVQQIHPLHGPCGMSQLQSQLQDFRLQQVLLERQRQMILARLAEQQQQEQGQHGAPNVSGSPAVKEDTIGDMPHPKVPVHVLQDYQLGLTLHHRRVQLQSAYRQESMEDSYAQLLLWGLKRSSPRTEDEAEILTDLKRLLEAGLAAIHGAMQEPPTVELTDEDRQLDLQLIQLNRLRYAVRDQHIAEGLVEPDEGIRRTMNTRLSSKEGSEDLRLHLDRRLA